VNLPSPVRVAKFTVCGDSPERCANVEVPRSEAGVACQPKLTRNAGKRERRLLSLIFASWNQIGEWLRRLDGVRQAT